eukprot:gene14249-biopygen5105
MTFASLCRRAIAAVRSAGAHARTTAPLVEEQKNDQTWHPQGGQDTGAGMARARRGLQAKFWLGVARARRGHVLFPQENAILCRRRHKKEGIPAAAENIALKQHRGSHRRGRGKNTLCCILLLRGHWAATSMRNKISAGRLLPPPPLRTHWRPTVLVMAQRSADARARGLERPLGM